MTTEKSIFFFHIPKTAGSSMQWILSQHFAQEEIAAAFTWTTLLGLDRKTLSRQKLFQGHFYGPLEKLVRQPLFRFTVLRDPVERALSHYGHVLRDNAHYLHQRALELGSLEAYLEDPVTQMTISNFQSRMLALDFDVEEMYSNLTDAERTNWQLERYIETTDFGLYGSELLSAAQAKLDSFDFVGITERFAETLALLCHKRGWKYPIEVHDKNINERRPRQTEFPASTLLRLTELNEIDIALYRNASAAFDESYRQMLAELIPGNSKKKCLQRFLECLNG